jgi:RNA polymerase sigma factor (sigma-70 family)
VVMTASANGPGSGRSSRSFEATYAAEAQRLAAAVVVMAGSRQVAEEVVAEAFVRAFERWARVSEMESPTGWIYRVAINVLRRRQRRETLERRLLRRVPRPDPYVVEIDSDLWLAVESLPPRARVAVGLRYVTDLTEREVAEVMGVAPGTVAATLHDARRRLAKDIRADDGQWPADPHDASARPVEEESDHVDKPSANRR